MILVKNDMCPIQLVYIRETGKYPSADPEGGGDRRSGAPLENQVIWVSVGNKQLDCPPLKNDSFL